MLPFLFLAIFGIIFFLSPTRVALAMAALMPLWIEWSFPQLLDINLGLVDVAVIGGALGTIFFPRSSRTHEGIPLKGLVLSYIGISLISFIANASSGFTLKNIWGSSKVIYVSVLFFLFYMVITDKSLIEKTLNLLLLSSVLASLIAIAQGVTQSPNLFFPIGRYGDIMQKAMSERSYGTLRAFGTLNHSNEWGAFLIWPLSICLALLLIHKDYPYRRFLPYAIGIQGLALILSFSRGAWLGFFLSVSVIAFYTKYYKRLSFYVLPLLLAAFIVSTKAIAPDLDILPGNVIGRLFSVAGYEEDDAMKPRYARWDYYSKKSFERPWTGFGIIVGEAELERFSAAPTPHNTFLSLAVRRGWIAVGIIVVIFFRFGVAALKLYKTSKDPFFKALGLGVLAGLLGVFGFAGFFGAFLEGTQVNILLWYLLALTMRSVNLDHEICSRDRAA